MRIKTLYLVFVALLASAGLWSAWSTWRAHRSIVTSDKPKFLSTNPTPAPSQRSSSGLNSGLPGPQPTPEREFNTRTPLSPPKPNQRFTDFTPEQRVQFARQGHGPGG